MDYKKWPEGVGVDLEFWNNRDLWWLLDAAAISMGIDPRVFRKDATDPVFHGGPNLCFDSFPGLHTKINDLCIMAKNGLFPVLRDGVNDHRPMWWCVRPSDYRDFMEGRAAKIQPTTSTTESGHDQQVDVVPHFATPSELVQYHRGRGVHELHELARLVDDYFTGKARLSDKELGMLLPAKGQEAESPEGCRSQGKRLRSLYKKSQ